MPRFDAIDSTEDLETLVEAMRDLGIMHLKAGTLELALGPDPKAKQEQAVMVALPPVTPSEHDSLNNYEDPELFAHVGGQVPYLDTASDRERERDPMT